MNANIIKCNCKKCGAEMIFDIRRKIVFCDCGEEYRTQELAPKNNKTVSRYSPAEKREMEIDAWISHNED